jgi:hypothetical protein
LSKRPGDPLVIRVYGDSLSLPRGPAGIDCQHTYAELLVREIAALFPSKRLSLYNRSRGGSTIHALYEHYLHDCSYFSASKDQVLVIQCGIVDCAPRPVPAFMRAAISRLPGRVRAPITAFLHRERSRLLRGGFSWRLTSTRRFTHVLTAWLTHAASQFAIAYVINIAPTVAATARQSPGLRESIVSYNKLIEQAVAAAPDGSAVLIDVHSAISGSEDNGLFVSPADGHHITRLGNDLYANLILREEVERLRCFSAPETQQ